MSSPGNRAGSVVPNPLIQEFGVSAFRQSGEPIGWDFELVKHLTGVGHNYWFVPNKNYVLTQQPSGSEGPWNPPAGGDPKLHVINVGNLGQQYLGSGLVVSAIDFAVLGCYKTAFEANPEMQVDIVRVSSDHQSKGIELANTDPTDTAARTEIENEMQQLAIQRRRLNGLKFDNRPYAIARHQDPKKQHVAMLQIDPMMNGAELKLFGQPYRALLATTKRLMGDVWDEEEDVPDWYEEPPQSGLQ